MEVMVPNAEIFSTAFTNWTHIDDNVRTIITIKINRHDDPHYVKTLILEALEEIPAVLTDPKPQVLMREMNDALLETEIRYFTNVKEHSRIGTRSVVLFNLWDKFKQTGIKPPYPQQDLYIQSVPPLETKT